MQLDKLWAITVFITVFFSAIVGAQEKGGCSHSTIAMIISPDDLWVASVDRRICSDGFFVTTVVNSVRVDRASSIETMNLTLRPVLPKVMENDVLAMEGPAPQQRPHLDWLSPTKLQITVPNLSLIGFKKERYQEVEILVKFEPDDPTARERWLKERGLNQK